MPLSILLPPPEQCTKIKSQWFQNIDSESLVGIFPSGGTWDTASLVDLSLKPGLAVLWANTLVTTVINPILKQAVEDYPEHPLLWVPDDLTVKSFDSIWLFFMVAWFLRSCCKVSRTFQSSLSGFCYGRLMRDDLNVKSFQIYLYAYYIYIYIIFTVCFVPRVFVR